MAKIPSNMDKSGFRKGEFVLYAKAGITPYTMRVRKGGNGWETYYHEANARQAGGVFTYATAETLAELAAKFA